MNITSYFFTKFASFSDLCPALSAGQEVTCQTASFYIIQDDSKKSKPSPEIFRMKENYCFFFLLTMNPVAC